MLVTCFNNDIYKLQYNYNDSLETNRELYYIGYILGCGVKFGPGMSILTLGTWPMLAATITMTQRILVRFTPMSTTTRRTRTRTTVRASWRLNPILDGISLLRGEVIPRLDIGSLHSFFSRNFFHRFNEIKKLVNDFCTLQPYRLSSIKIARLEVG